MLNFFLAAAALTAALCSDALACFSTGVANPRLFAQFQAAHFHMLCFFYQQPCSETMLFGNALVELSRNNHFVCVIVAYLSSYREKAINAL